MPEQHYLQSLSTAGLARAKRNAALESAVIAVVVIGVTGVASELLFVLGALAIVAGFAFCLTLVGAVIGIPLVLLGFLAIVGGFVGSAGGLVFAIGLGVGVGYLWYRHRLRRLGAGAF
jgi:hypothetical protein